MPAFIVGATGHRGEQQQDAAGADNPFIRRHTLANIISARPRPSVEIALDDQQAGYFVPSYTTLERIQGTVSVRSHVDAAFDSIRIVFQGTSKTYVEKVVSAAPTSPRSQAFHTFLRLEQPMSESDMPEGGVLRAERTYRFPFTFVVPERLLPQSCQHPVESDLVKHAHLALPPSLGDPMLAGDGKALLDDLAPDMTVISYALRVIITRGGGGGGGGADPLARPTVVADSMKKLRIIPAVDEAAPLRAVGGHEDDFVLSRTKELKRGLFKGRLGTLTVETSQPPSLHLPPVRSSDACATTTMATVRLRFQPATASAEPPCLCRLWTRLKIATFFSTVPLRSVPRKHSDFAVSGNSGLFVETVPLSSRSVRAVAWTRQAPSRRDSAVSLAPSLPPPSSPRGAAASSVDAAAAKPSGSSDGGAEAAAYYTAHVLVPIDLPTASKTFVPSFHSCLISRSYALDVVLSFRPPAATVSAPTLHLRAPLQISAAGNKDAVPLVSPEEAAAIARREADMDLAPRSLEPPSPQYTEREAGPGRPVGGGAGGPQSIAISRRASEGLPPSYHAATTGNAWGRR